MLATGDPPTRTCRSHPAETLVVGAGTSGQQLAFELRQAGRDVVLAAGRHSRAPRRYRGRDIFEWAHIFGDFDRTVDELPDVEAAKRVPLFLLSGANGGEDLGLDRLAAAGVTVHGPTRYQYRRNPHFTGGVGRDAETVARSIVGSRAVRRRMRTPAVAA